MAVHIFTFSVVIVQNMRCFKSENLGNAYHPAKISILNFSIGNEFSINSIVKILNLIHNQLYEEIYFNNAVSFYSF